MHTRTLGFCCRLLLSLSLMACGAAPSRPDAPPPFADAHFKPPQVAVDASQVFAMTPAMQRYAETVLRPAMRYDNPERALIDALYDSGKLKLEYDAERTRTAGGAFEARAGNCLSLVMMTGTFARYFEVPIRYQEVINTSTWSRSGNIALSNRHVNLSLTRQSSGPTVSLGEQSPGDGGLTVDFMPPPQASRLRTRAISEDTVVAMYLNNRAAELLADGQLDEAYWWAREAIRKLPDYTDSYNTLGVIYQQHGDLDEAERILRHALALEPENTIPMSNLVGLLKGRGQVIEAQQWADRLAALEPYPPFFFHDQGMVALKAGEFGKARELFQRELRREASQPDAHFWLGIADMYLGEYNQARTHLAKAIENSTTTSSRQLYSAKLDWLKAQGYEDHRRHRSTSSGS